MEGEPPSLACDPQLAPDLGAGGNRLGLHLQLRSRRTLKIVKSELFIMVITSAARWSRPITTEKGTKSSYINKSINCKDIGN